jgi:hypothetical protein
VEAPISKANVWRRALPPNRKGARDARILEKVEPSLASELAPAFGAVRWFPLAGLELHMNDAQAEQWRPMDTAPTDGTIVRLLVDYRGEDACHPLEDAAVTHTIGGNTDGNTGLREGWKFAGWSWEQDCFCEGRGKPIGWLVEEGVVEARCRWRDHRWRGRGCEWLNQNSPTPPAMPFYGCSGTTRAAAVPWGRRCASRSAWGSSTA